MIIYLNNKIKSIINLIYTKYIAHLVMTIGEKSLISYPIYIYNGRKIKVGENFKTEKRVRLEAFGDNDNVIIIGNNVHINWNTHIGGLKTIQIEDNVLIGSNVLITDHSHGENSDINELLIPPARRKLYSKGSVIIRKNVWIGENVAILPDVEIGENCIVGANAVVTKSFPANCIIGGNPAKIIKKIGQ